MKVLVVEDNIELASCVRAALAHLGHQMVHASSTQQAVACVEAEVFDAAMLDVDLEGEKSTSVASLLEKKQIPYVVATAHRRDSVPLEINGKAHLRKPYALEDLERALDACGVSHD